MKIFEVDGKEIDIAGLGRTIHENGRNGQEREYLCFADGLGGKHCVVLVSSDCMEAVATIEGMPGKVRMLPEVETTRFDGFPECDDDRMPADWLQELIAAERY